MSKMVETCNFGPFLLSLAMGKKGWTTIFRKTVTVMNVCIFMQEFLPNLFKVALFPLALTGWTTSIPSLCSGHQKSIKSTRSPTTTAERSSINVIAWWRRRRPRRSTSTSLIVSVWLLKPGRYGTLHKKKNVLM